MVRDWSDAAKDRLLAAALAVLLAAVWTVRDWPDLVALRLPDTDDVMRLQQIRDWLAGQPFADVSQHRLGAAPGLVMHWSRLADLVPGGLVAALSPAIGGHAAQIAAVVVWPMLLFAAALVLIASIARALDGGPAARVALVVAAIGYPATTLFVPGRIDHHGFQIVLLLSIVRALIVPPSWRTGAWIAVASVMSVVIGLETAPFALVAGLIVWAGWLRGGSLRFEGFAAALAVTLVVARLLFRTDGWDYPACDAFDAIVWRAGAVVAGAALLLAFGLRGYAAIRTRIVGSAVAAAATAALLTRIAPDCIDPYDRIDPVLRRLWLAHVAEAQPLFHAAPATAIGYAGLLVAGLGATIWAIAQARGRGWRVLLAFQATALALTVIELRGAYAGAILAAPALGALIVRARTKGIAALTGAWLVSAGTLYPIAAGAVTPHAAATATATGDALAAADCTTPDAVARLAALPPGTLMAPVDMGAYAIAATRDRVIAAPYHRNDAANLAMYRFFLGTPARAARIAGDWRVDYVALCTGSFGELGPVARDPRRLVGALAAGRPPSWLHRIGPSATAPAIYRVAPPPEPES